MQSPHKPEASSKFSSTIERTRVPITRPAVLKAAAACYRKYSVVVTDRFMSSIKSGSEMASL